MKKNTDSTKELACIRWKGEWAYVGHKIQSVRDGMVRLKATFASGRSTYTELPSKDVRAIRGNQTFEL